MMPLVSVPHHPSSAGFALASYRYPTRLPQRRAFASLAITFRIDYRHCSTETEAPFAMDLSIVTTLYRSETFVREFYERATAVARLVSDNYEIVFTNDGSPDHSLDAALALCEEDERVKVVDLSRNFGHHKALIAGLAHATGRRIFFIDVDLEEQPEWLVEFAEAFDRLRVDVVYGVQRKRGRRG